MRDATTKKNTMPSQTRSRMADLDEPSLGPIRNGPIEIQAECPETVIDVRPKETKCNRLGRPIANYWLICVSAFCRGWLEMCTKPWKGCSNSRIRNTALETTRLPSSSTPNEVA